MLDPLLSFTGGVVTATIARLYWDWLMSDDDSPAEAPPAELPDLVPVIPPAERCYSIDSPLWHRCCLKRQHRGPHGRQLIHDPKRPIDCWWPNEEDPYPGPRTPEDDERVPLE